MSTIRVRIPSRFNASVACWEGEIEDTGNTARNLGNAVLEALKQGADMSGANMSGADMFGANMSGADMSGADMSGADMSGADMSGANMSGANMSRANMSRANMSGAYMSGANMSGAIGAELPIARTRILPEGSLIGWKQLHSGIIAKLRIPEGAKRSHAFGRKCRAEFAEVLELWTPEGTPAPFGVSQHDVSFRYEVGKTVRPSTPFSEDWQEECEPGIHFYITRLEAENHT